MSEEAEKEIFSKNLMRYIQESGKTQKEVADAIGVSPQILNMWVRGLALPRMWKVQKLADYFGIKKSDLIDKREKNNGQQPYYLNPEAAEMAQAIFNDPDLHALFDASRNVSAENLRLTAEMLRRLKDTNPDG